MIFMNSDGFSDNPRSSRGKLLKVCQVDVVEVTGVLKSVEMEDL
jgi:hypothetical protein